jgi:hypothetical protein
VVGHRIRDLVRAHGSQPSRFSPWFAWSTMERVRSAIRRLVTVAGVAFVGSIGFADDWTVGPIVIGLGAVLPAVPTFAISAVAYGLVQYGASRWMLRGWNDWLQRGHGRRIEQHLEKWRRGRIMRYPVRWITHGSPFWYGLASVIFAPVVVVAVAQLASEEPVPDRRVVLSSVIYGIWFAGLYTAIGYGIGTGVRSA